MRLESTRFRHERTSAESHDSTKKVNATFFYRFYSSAKLFESIACSRSEWVGGKRGAGVRGTEYGFSGYGVRGSGKHRVCWKIRGLVENTGSKWKTQGNHYFAQQWVESKFCYFKLQWKSIGVKRVFGHKSELNIFWERKPVKCQSAVQWFSSDQWLRRISIKLNFR